MIEHRQIAALIPHAGAMCLLDKVVSWDANSIRCLTTHHRSSDNPLKRADGSAPSVRRICGAGDGAAWSAGRRRERCAAAGISCQPARCRLHTPFLDQVDGEIVIDAALLMGDGRGVIYPFALGTARDNSPAAARP